MGDASSSEILQARKAGNTVLAVLEGFATKLVSTLLQPLTGTFLFAL